MLNALTVRAPGLRVGYALTPAGRSLLPHVHALKRWAEAHLASVERGNAGFDSAADRAADRAARSRDASG